MGLWFVQFTGSQVVLATSPPCAKKLFGCNSSDFNIWDGNGKTVMSFTYSMIVHIMSHNIQLLSN